MIIQKVGYPISVAEWIDEKSFIIGGGGGQGNNGVKNKLVRFYNSN